MGGSSELSVRPASIAPGHERRPGCAVHRTRAGVAARPRSARRARAEPAARRREPFRVLLATLYVVSFAIIAWLAVQGSSFYLTPLGERAHHPGYWDWKSGGRIGRPLGVVGAGMMILMLGYSARKRLGVLRRLGPLSRWLDLHIFLGIVGPSLVVLHSAFKVQGLVALSFWSMIVVAASGVFGRYLYLKIPRTRAGEEVQLAALERIDAELSDRLRRQFQLDEATLARLEALAAGTRLRGGLLPTLVAVLVDDLTRGRGLRRFARACRGVPIPLQRAFEQVVRQKAEARRRIHLWGRLRDLFHYWHVIHKPFAVVVYLFLALHVAVAVLTGYGWGGP
jgi:hypothetical protein